MDRLKYFKSEFNTQGRRGENDDVTALGRWAAVNNSFPEHISESTCLIVFNTQLLGYLNFDLLRRFEAHFVSGADLEKYWADDSHIAHTCSLRSLVVPFQVFGP